MFLVHFEEIVQSPSPFLNPLIPHKSLSLISNSLLNAYNRNQKMLQGQQNSQNFNIDLSDQPKAKYQGYGSNNPDSTTGSLTTLDEDVKQTIKRDLNMVYQKIQYVFRLKEAPEKLEELRKNWDLWGPLLISLSIAAFVTIGAYGNHQQLFTNLFVVLWVGPLIISINSRMLGAKIALIQSICLVIYCTSPILILSFVIFIIRLFWHSFILNICLSVFAVTFTVRGAQLYFRELVREDKKYLVLYPVILFYVFLATYMSMA